MRLHQMMVNFQRLLMRRNRFFYFPLPLEINAHLHLEDRTAVEGLNIPH